MYGLRSLTCQTVPLVDCEETVGCDGDDSRRRQTWLGVGRHVGHGRVGWELQHHDNILLHLLRKHQRGLQEKILFRPPGRTTGRREEKVGRAEIRSDRRRAKTERREKQPRPVLAREKTKGKGRKEKDREKVRKLEQDSSEQLFSSTG